MGIFSRKPKPQPVKSARDMTYDEQIRSALKMANKPKPEGGKKKNGNKR